MTKTNKKYRMKIDKGSDSMVKLGIKNNIEKTTWGGDLSNHIVTKERNKYEDKLEDPSL